MKAAELGCHGAAQHAAELLEKQFPEIVFTSGYRSPAQQAHAMASNVVSNRKWIGQTYRASRQIDALQKWVDTHPSADTVDEITTGLFSVMGSFSEEEIGTISKHLSGQAWDVKPMLSPRGDAVKAAIRTLPGLTQFLEREGGLIRWHCSF